MPYSKFTLARVIEDFDLPLVEGEPFLPPVEPRQPSALLQELLQESLPWAITVGSEKARSEAIINPVLLEVKRQLGGRVSVFSGEEFNVDPGADLIGYCDFIDQPLDGIDQPLDGTVVYQGPGDRCC